MDVAQPNRCIIIYTSGERPSSGKSRILLMHGVSPREVELRADELEDVLGGHATALDLLALERRDRLLQHATPQRQQLARPDLLLGCDMCER